MKQLVYDIESDDLLMGATRIWCIVAKDPDTGEVFRYGPDEIHKGYEKLLSADRLIGHNVRMFDDRVLARLCDPGGGLLGAVLPDGFPPSVDTLLLSRLVYPDKYSNPVGGHSLGDWGEYLGAPKTDHTDFSQYTHEMLDYCENDVDVTHKVYEHLLPKAAPMGYAVTLEHRVASIIAQQIENGVEFFADRADALVQDIQLAQAEAMQELSGIPPWVEVVDLKTPHYWIDPMTDTAYKRKGDAPATKKEPIRSRLVPGPPKFRCEATEFNPNSGDLIARLFIEKYGWVPEKMTDAGKPVTDEKVISSLDYPEAKTIAHARMLDKRLGQISQWFQHARGNRIHGSIITTGTVTGRMSHSKPNMGQIPKVGNPYGAECRACFGPREGWLQMGCDASGLQARLLGHYMAEFDGGAYCDVILNGDIHSHNQEMAGLPTRDNAKTFFYGYLFGAGNAKIGSITGKGAAAGKKLKDQFKRSLPGLQKLENSLGAMVKRGYIVALDGRHIPIRQDYMALNALLMSAEACVMKQALLYFYESACTQYGPHGGRWGLMLNVHDELQAECEPEIAKGLGALAEQSIRKAGEHFELRIRLDGEAKVGESWASTH